MARNRHGNRTAAERHGQTIMDLPTWDGVSVPIAALLLAAALTGCRTHRAPDWPSNSGEAGRKIDLATLSPGAIQIQPGTGAPRISVDPANPRVESIGEGAADATRSVLNTPHIGQPHLEAGLGALEAAVAPFAAAYGAISASQLKLSMSEMSSAREALGRIMSSNAVPDTLVQMVGELGRQRTRRSLICDLKPEPGSAAARPLSAILEVSVHELRLSLSRPGGSQYILQIVAGARLARIADGKVLLQRSYHYESGPALFIDWTRYGGLDSVAQTGYRSLAGEIAEDFFEPIAQPPIWIGPGRPGPHLAPPRLSGRGMRRAPARWLTFGKPDPRGECRVPEGVSPQTDCGRPTRRLAAGHRTVRALGRRRSALPEVAFQFVSLVQEEVGAMEIHTGRTDDRLQLTTPGQESGSASEEMSDTKWELDGLEHDRNAVVQGLSCLAAVPFGIWEQTVGLVRTRSIEKNEDYVRTLNQVTTREHFEGTVADEVAQSLQTKVLDPIRRTDLPIRFAIPDSGLTNRTGLASTSATEPSKTALEIQVLSTRLIGKHRNSRARAVLVEMRVTLFRTSDGQEIYSRPIRYQSSSKPLKAWTASDAKLFRRELESCSREAAQALVRDLIAQGFVAPLINSNRAVPATGLAR